MIKAAASQSARIRVKQHRNGYGGKNAAERATPQWRKREQEQSPMETAFHAGRQGDGHGNHID